MVARALVREMLPWGAGGGDGRICSPDPQFCYSIRMVLGGFLPALT